MRPYVYEYAHVSLHGYAFVCVRVCACRRVGVRVDVCVCQKSRPGISQVVMGPFGAPPWAAGPGIAAGAGFVKHRIPGGRRACAEESEGFLRIS